MTLARKRSIEAPPLRPVWVVITVTLIGALLVAFVIAYGDYVYGYFFVLSALLIAIAAGIFAALITDRLAWQNRRAIALAGLAMAFFSYFMIWVFAYLLRLDALPEGMGLFDYIASRLDSLTLGRRGRELFTVGAIWAIGIWLAEVVLLIYLTWIATPMMHDAFRSVPHRKK